MRKRESVLKEMDVFFSLNLYINLNKSKNFWIYKQNYNFLFFQYTVSCYSSYISSSIRFYMYIHIKRFQL